MPRLGAARTRDAFTLVEALAVVAVVGVLLGLMLPSLSGARIAARNAACAAMQKQLVTGLLRYAAHHDDWIPGFNTSGYSLWPSASPQAVAALSRHSTAPVQVNDWITPALADPSLPESREERFYTLLERCACPSMELRAPVWLGGDLGARAMTDWIESAEREPARGVSYLMPTNFQLFGGPRIPRDPIATQYSSRTLQDLARICRIRNDYRPRLDLIGNVAAKIALADGFRYLGLRVIDFDASWSHANWGSFTERSACDIESRAWGRRGGGGTGFNLSVVYRHNSGMNAAFWDGHVDRLTIKASRNPSLWAPARSQLMPAATLDPDSRTFGPDPTNPARWLIN